MELILKKIFILNPDNAFHHYMDFLTLLSGNVF